MNVWELEDKWSCVETDGRTDVRTERPYCSLVSKTNKPNRSFNEGLHFLRMPYHHRPKRQS
jgi:hypothetical protein